MPAFSSQVLDRRRVPMRRGAVPQNFSRCPEDCFTRSRRSIMVSIVVKRAHSFYFTKVFSYYFLLPPSPSAVKWCTLPLRLKWWLATIRTPLPVRRGRDPSPLTPEVVCVFKMATPYVTDETGGECGSRGVASPRALGVGVRTWKGVCAPPIPGPLLCPALRTAFPIHSLLRGVICAPFWSRVLGSLLPVTQTLGSFSDGPCSRILPGP